MYLSHYNLKEKPFQINSDPKFIWLGENHREGLAVLEYGVIDNKGFLLITGDVGTGKTTLINALLIKLGDNTVVANVSNPILEQLDFLNIVANEFNINKYFSKKADFLIYFNRFLNECYKQKKKVILIIDEAHKLHPDLLEQIRLLSNIERQDTKLINIFFVGQNEFLDIISDKQQRALRQRITISYHLNPLKEDEVKAYIGHRLNVAGLQENIFSDPAMREIYSFSNGYPRLINIICDHALLTGYVKEVKLIDEEIIKECANGLALTRGNSDEHSNYQNITPNEILETDKNSATAPATYNNKLNFPEQRAAYLYANPEAKQSAANRFVQQPATKSSRKTFGYAAGALLLLIVLGFLFYPVNLVGYIDNVKDYFKPATHIQGKNAAADLTQNNQPDETKTPAAQVANEYGDAQLQPAAINAANELPSGVEETNSVEPEKVVDVKESPPIGDVDQESEPDTIDESKKALADAVISDRKYIINFKYNSYDLSDFNLPSLNLITGLLDRHSDAKLVVKGYTDASGNNTYNKKLSAQRARFVKNYLVAKGIDASRIEALGMGEADPLESNNTKEGRRQNRRVEIEFSL